MSSALALVAEIVCAAVKVLAPFLSGTFEDKAESAIAAAGRVRVPEDRVKPLEAVSKPAAVIVPVPVVAMVPVVEMAMLAVRSDPLIRLVDSTPAAEL